MTINLYVGNLSYGVRDEDLKTAFAEFGEVTSARVMMDRDNPNRSRGFGFVEFANKEDGEKAIEALNGQDLDGRPLKVNESQPREDRPRSGGQGGGNRGGNGGGYRGGNRDGGNRGGDRGGNRGGWRQ